MDKLKEEFRAAAEALEQNQQKIKDVDERVPELRKEIERTETLLKKTINERELAVEGLILGDVSESEVREVMAREDDLKANLKMLNASIDASERLSGRLVDESRIFSEKKNRAEARIWKAVADRYQKELVDLAGDLPGNLFAALEAAHPGSVISISWNNVFSPGTVEDRQVLRKKMRAGLGF